MAVTGYHLPMELLGRLAELAACQEALSGEHGQARAVMITGPPGIGKTSLWRAAADVAAAGLPGRAVVLRTTGVPGAPTALAGLADLLDPVIAAALPTMPPPQASALRAALGQALPQVPVTDVVLERALVGLLRDLAAAGLVIAVDDEQWLDDDSRRLLQAAAVRLSGVPARWLVSSRFSGAGQGFGQGLTRVLARELGPRAAWIHVNGLDDAALSELVASRFPGPWSASVLRQVITLAAGNPYTALEVARETVARGGQHGRSARIPAGLTAATRQRLDRLRPPTLAVIQVAALTAAPARALLRAVLPGPVDEHVDEAIEAGILHASPPDPLLRFSHPLLREAAEGMLTGPRKRRLHRDIGAAIDDPREAAWHLGQGADEPDEALAQRLQLAAEDALVRGTPARAAELAQAAVELTPDPNGLPGWHRRLVWLATLTAANEFGQVRRQGEKWATQVPDAMRGWLAVLRSRVETNAQDHLDLLVTAADDATGPDPLRSALASAEASIVLGLQLGQLAAARRLAAAAIPHAQATGIPVLLRGVMAADGLLAVLAGEPGAGDQLRAAIAIPGFADNPVPYESPESALAAWHIWRGEHRPARDLLRPVLAAAERTGSGRCRFSAHVALAYAEWLAGDWAASSAHVKEAARWNRESGYDRGWQLALVKSLVLAGRGDVAEARAVAAGGLREAEAQREWDTAAGCRYVLSMTELSLDDPVAALRWLDPVSDLPQAGDISEPGCRPFVPDLIEAWATTGRLDAAADRLGWLQDAARRLDHPWARITSGRAGAVLRMARRDPAGAVDAVAAVIGEARACPLPFELGRCLLVLGTAQRKARQRREAASTLDEAAAIFGRLGARPWQELVAAQRARLAPGRDDDLTPTERRVAELVASGRSNPEIAASMFISVKTVEANLTRVYRKLGLRGRVDLARHALGSGDSWLGD
jgi:DNA-binding CsgD family transcriptional regulator